MLRAQSQKVEIPSVISTLKRFRCSAALSALAFPYFANCFRLIPLKRDRHNQLRTMIRVL